MGWIINFALPCDPCGGHRLCTDFSQVRHGTFILVLAPRPSASFPSWAEARAGLGVSWGDSDVPSHGNMNTQPNCAGPAGCWYGPSLWRTLNFFQIDLRKKNKIRKERRHHYLLSWFLFVLRGSVYGSDTSDKYNPASLEGPLLP